MAKHRHRGVYEATFEAAPKAVAKVLKAARRAGASITITGSGHFQIRTAQGVIHAACTPRDGDLEAKRIRSQLRNHGLDI